MEMICAGMRQRKFHRWTLYHAIISFTKDAFLNGYKHQVVITIVERLVPAVVIIFPFTTKQQHKLLAIIVGLMENYLFRMMLELEYVIKKFHRRVFVHPASLLPIPGCTVVFQCIYTFY